MYANQYTACASRKSVAEPTVHLLSGTHANELTDWLCPERQPPQSGAVRLGRDIRDGHPRGEKVGEGDLHGWDRPRVVLGPRAVEACHALEGVALEEAHAEQVHAQPDVGILVRVHWNLANVPRARLAARATERTHAP